jgi:hypothetical protein
MDRILAEMKTPMPAKITLAGENTFILYQRLRKLFYASSRVETYQTDAPRDSGRKCAQDIHSGAQPLRQPLVATVGFVKFSDLVLEESNDGGSRVAGFQLGGKRMGEKVILGLLSVEFQGSLKNGLEA